MRKTMLALLALSIFSAHADENEFASARLRDTAIALTVADWLYTHDIADRCATEDVRESNVVLGRCPTRAQVDTYFAGVAVAWGMFAYALPPKYRNWLHAGIVGIEVNALAGNIRLGLQMTW